MAAWSLISPHRPPASAPGSGRLDSRWGSRRRRGRSPGRASPSSLSHPRLPSSSPPNREASGSVGEEITTPAVALRKISAAAAPLVAGDGSEGSGEPRKIAEEPKARARRGEPAGLRRARVAGSRRFPLGAPDAPPRLRADLGAGRVGGGCRRPAFSGNNPCLSLCVSLSATSAPTPHPQKQEDGPREKQPPPDHAPVRGADFEGNLSRTAEAQPASGELPGSGTTRRGPAGGYRLCLLGAPGGSGSRFCRKSPSLVASVGCCRRC